MQRIVIFGAGVIADVLASYIEHDKAFEIAAFCIDEQYVTTDTHLGRPLVPFETVQDSYPPDQYAMIVAIGYHGLNEARAAKCGEAKDKGYRLESFVSAHAHRCGPVQVGENCIVLDNVTLQPGVSIGNDVVIWSMSLIGHHSTIRDHAWIASMSVISGNCTIGERCFLGVNTLVGHEVTVGDRCFFGAGASVTEKTIEPDGVYVDTPTARNRIPSGRFARLAGM